MTAPNISLPGVEKLDSAAPSKLFFDSYGKKPLEFSADDFNAAIGFFLKKGFEEDAAKVTAAVFVRQAKLDGVRVSAILDKFLDVDGLALSVIITQILNRYRSINSTLGFRSLNVVKPNQIRNIRP